jgi:hypothetical protein
MEMMFCRALIRFSNENSFSLREKGRMRGKPYRQLSYVDPRPLDLLSPTLPLRGNGTYLRML